MNAGEFARDGRFHTTRWSVVRRASGGSEDGRSALAQLCEMYWQPLYFFLRRRGHDPEESLDLVQGFLESLLRRGRLGELREEGGRFRSYLIAALRHYLANERMKERAQKRGGGVRALRLDLEDAEHAYQQLAIDNQTPERAYEKQWALRLLEGVLRRLEDHYRTLGQEDLFHALKGTITGEMEESYAAVGERFAMSEGAIKTAAHRLRSRYQTCFKETILETVGEEEFEDEVRFLLQALGKQ